jgi:hypothetical protein
MASNDVIKKRLINAVKDADQEFTGALDARVAEMPDNEAKAARKSAIADHQKPSKDVPKKGSRVTLAPIFNGTKFEGREGVVTHVDQVELGGRVQTLPRIRFDGGPVVKTRFHFAMRPGYLVVISTPAEVEPEPETKPEADAEAPAEVAAA